LGPDLELAALTKWLASQASLRVSAGFSTEPQFCFKSRRQLDSVTPRVELLTALERFMLFNGPWFFKHSFYRRKCRVFKCLSTGTTHTPLPCHFTLPLMRVIQKSYCLHKAKFTRLQFTSCNKRDI
jgi:hypothetical protein